MALYRSNHKMNYTVINNEPLRDKNISFAAKGLLTWAMSVDEGTWKFSETGIAGVSKEGRSAVRTALKELEEAGYLKRTKIRSENGKFLDVLYDFYDYNIKNP